MQHNVTNDQHLQKEIDKILVLTLIPVKLFGLNWAGIDDTLLSTNKQN